MRLGIDRLVSDHQLIKNIQGRRIAFLGHAASLTSELKYSIDEISHLPRVHLTAGFGPQHGVRGEKQDNMIETEDFTDPKLQIPIFSLYGNVRKPTDKMMNTFDLLLVDLQEIGCRIYTYITTLCYMLEACSKHNKEIWILDRPNPIGRPIEGVILKSGYESFVGVGPLPIRHGLTIGELTHWMVDHFKISVNYRVIPMENYQINEGPGFGWPVGHLSWTNPSPNASNIFMARCFPGTVLIEGTELSEGRGTTHPLEVVGAPRLDIEKILSCMKSLANNWMRGCVIRPFYFEPTFQKHKGELCFGIQIHVDHKEYSHEQFKPFRLIALWLRSLREVYPKMKLWRIFEYEYEKDRMAIDLISGSALLRDWVDAQEKVEVFEQSLVQDELMWENQRKKYLIY